MTKRITLSWQHPSSSSSSFTSFCCDAFYWRSRLTMTSMHQRYVCWKQKHIIIWESNQLRYRLWLLLWYDWCTSLSEPVVVISSLGLRPLSVDSLLSSLELDESLELLSDCTLVGLSIRTASMIGNSSGRWMRNARNQCFASFGRPRTVLCQTIGKFVIEQKFCVTAIVSSRFSTTCHQPDGTNIISPGRCTASIYK